jgi:hypothetical protein
VGLKVLTKEIKEMNLKGRHKLTKGTKYINERGLKILTKRTKEMNLLEEPITVQLLKEEGWEEEGSRF